MKKIDRILFYVGIAVLVINAGMLIYWNVSKSEKHMQDRADQLFAYGEKALNANDFKTSLFYFKQVVDDYPNSLVAEEAQFVIGDIYLINKRDFSQAVDEYHKYVNKYPNGRYRNRAILKLNFIHKYRKDKDAAVTTLKGFRLLEKQDFYGAAYLFKKVIDNYPSAKVTEYAKEKFDEIAKKRPGIVQSL